MIKYWEEEKPLEIKEGNLSLQFYDQADALNLKMYFYNSEEEKVADDIKTAISLRKKFMLESPEILLTLKEVFAEWYEELEAESE